MKLLVTGGAGFIGSNFIHYWLENYPEDQIVNLDLLTYAGNLNNLTDVVGDSRYRFVQGDIADEKLIAELYQQVDTVVNFAAESHVDRSITGSKDFIHSNVEGVRVLLDGLKVKPEIRFHHVSTDEVFGSLNAGDPEFNEQTPYAPNSPYSASKASSDHLVRAYQHTFNLKTTISNCSNNYGPYQYPEKLIPLFITNLIDNLQVPVYGTGANIRDWLHVADHCRAIELILQKGKIGETYCVGGGNEITNLQITNMILEASGKGQEMIKNVADRLGHDLRYAIDYGKIKNELGWEPTINFVEGLAQTIAWYTANENWWRPLKQ